MQRTVCFLTTDVLIWDELPAAEFTKREPGSLQRLKTIESTIKHHRSAKTHKHTYTAAHACTHQVLLNLCTVCTCTRAHSGINSSILSSGVCFARPPEASGKHWTVIPSFCALFSLQGGKIITLQAQNNSRGNEIILFYPGFVSSSVKYVQYEIEHLHLRIHFNN